jgi:hypothetical protein
MEAEFHHFCTVQITYNTIVSFLLSLFGLSFCLICIYTMDYSNINNVFGTQLQPGQFFQKFAFACYADGHFWNLEKYELTNGQCRPTGFPKFWAVNLFTCHQMYIFIYTTLHIFVMAKIPFWYDRFEKEPKEEKKDRLRLGKISHYLQWKIEERS